MPAIKQWAFSLCAAMVACGIVRMLLPNSGMEKMFRIVVSVFFLCCILSPIILNAPGLMAEVPVETRQEIKERSSRLSLIADEQALGAAKKNLERLIVGNLSEKGIKAHAITININTNGQNSQSAISADITLDRAHEAEHNALVKELGSELGFTVRIGYSKEGE